MRAIRLRTQALKILHFGRSAYCPVCSSWLRSFSEFGEPARPRARCPVCGALERHRLLFAYLLQAITPRTSRARVLHVAPEPPLAAHLSRNAAIAYVSADLGPRPAHVRADITSLGFKDSAFDIVICSHVLEHVSDDLAAIRELRRVLRVDGWAAIQVPIFDGPTIEGARGLSPDRRRALFGQADHLRRYGEDYLEHLALGGLLGRRVRCADFISGRDAGIFALDASEELAVCTRTRESQR